MLRHTSAQSHSNILAMRCAHLCIPSQAGLEIHFASAWRRPDLNEKNIIAALGVQLPPTLPIRKNVKRPFEIKSPRIKNSGDRRDENSAQEKDYSHLQEAANESGPSSRHQS